jgi:hypothetical protein
MILEGANKDKRHDFLWNHADGIPEEKETECAYGL